MLNISRKQHYTSYSPTGNTNISYILLLLLITINIVNTYYYK